MAGAIQNVGSHVDTGQAWSVQLPGICGMKDDPASIYTTGVCRRGLC